MAFDAGSVVGHFDLETGGYEAGAKKVGGSNKSMTGSVLKAQIAFEAIKMAIRAVVGVVKDSVLAYTEGEKLLAQTAATLKSTGYAAGLTKKEVAGLAAGFQDLTTFDDEAVLSAENLLLTFTKIGKDVFPAATQTVLDMATALGTDARGAAQQLGFALQDPIMGMQRLRRSGIVFTESQKATVKSLVETGRVAEAQQLILAELDKKYGGSAAAVRNTFGGALAALKNHLGDVQESFGQYIAIAGKPFVEELVKMAKGVVDFISSAEGMARIQSILAPLAGTFAVIFSIGKEVWNLFKNFAAGVLKDIKDGFTQVVGKGNESSAAFDTLGGVVKLLSIGFMILGKVVRFIIQAVVDLIAVARESWKVLEALGYALTHPFEKDVWKKVGDASKQAWASMTTFAVNAFNSIKDIVISTVKEFETFETDAKATGVALQATYVKAVADMNKAFEDFALQAGTVAPAAIVSGNDDAGSEVAASWTEVFTGLVKQVTFAKETYGAFSIEARDASKALSDHIVSLAQETDTAWQATYDSLLTASQAAVQQFGAYSVEAATAITALNEHIQNKGKETKTEVEATWGETFAELKDELKKASEEFGIFSKEAGVAFSAVAAHVQDKVSEALGVINSLFAQVMDILNQALDNRMAALDASYAADKKRIEDTVVDETDKAAQLAALDEQYAAKKAAIQKKQWLAQKAASVASIIMSTAEGVMSALSKFPGPVGWVLSGLIAALGAVQVGLVLAQPEPQFAAEGGTFRSGDRVIVGEQGPEMLTIGATSTVTPNDELSKSMAGGVSSDVPVIITVALDGRVIIKRVERAVRDRELILQAKDIAS